MNDRADLPERLREKAHQSTRWRSGRVATDHVTWQAAAEIDLLREKLADQARYIVRQRRRIEALEAILTKLHPGLVVVAEEDGGFHAVQARNGDD